MNPLDALSGIVTDLSTWAGKPYNSGQGLGGWFLWVGVLVVMVVAWTMIIHEIEIDT